MGKISRRDYLKISGATLAAVVAARGTRALLANSTPPEVSFDKPKGTSAKETMVKTACALCPSGCGLVVRVVNGRAVKVDGNPAHPLNQGVCCLKGQTALEVLYSPERLQGPVVQTGKRGSGELRGISWDEALGLVTNQLSRLREAGLAHTVAFLYGETRGEMRALINRFMTAYGSPNAISQESLGEGAVRLAMWLTQGINGIPVYDLEHTRYVIAFGGNLLESSQHVINTLAATAFMRRTRPDRGKLVAVHPRLSLTGIKADEWLPIRPGTYGALALGMANVIISNDMYDQDFVRNFTFGFEDFQDEAGNWHQGYKSLVLEKYTLDRVEYITGVSQYDITRLAGEFATNRPSVAIVPTEPRGLASGNSVYTAMAIYTLNALVGSFDVPGGVLVQRFPPVAPWPDVEQDDVAKAGLSHERIDGAGSGGLSLALSAYQNVANSILESQPYPVNALFLYNANPVYEVPDGGRFAQALMNVPFVVSFAPTLDESAAHADLVLPAGTFLEVWGDDYIQGTGYAGVSLRQPVVEPGHDTRDPGDVLLTLAPRLGGAVARALPYNSYKDLVEYRLSKVGLDRTKYEENGFWSELLYFHAQPGSPAWNDVVGRDRLDVPKDGRFDLYSRQLLALLAASESPSFEQLDLACLPHYELPSNLVDNTEEAATYPFLLLTQDLITQSQYWQGIVPTLQECYGLQMNVKWSSWVEINPRAAEALGVKDGDLVWVESPAGRMQVPVRFYEGLWPDAVYMPPGQGRRTWVKWGHGAASNIVIGANPNQLSTAKTEPLVGMAIVNPTRVRIYKA
jgi:anaerobic selenocysteine-containing dehydrogenase